MMDNLILNIDSYKASHYLQYPAKTEFISSYIEARGGVFDATLFFGLQVFLQQYLAKPITMADIDEAEDIITAHGLPFCRQNWEYIVQKHRGFLPLTISAVPEGSIIPVRNVLVEVINTDPNCAYLTSYMETALLRAVWYPTTVATLSWRIKGIIGSYLEQTSESLDGLTSKLHDFGARGVSSLESAALGGLAHLVNFMGTDTVPALVYARRYYHCDMAGFSIPASEHSTMTAWGKDAEQQAFEHMLNTFAGEGKTVAVVSDSYDLYHAIDCIWGQSLKERVINNGGVVVIRPDSGDPVLTVLGVIERLMSIFGCSYNTKGYRLLPPYLRILQGDGINEISIGNILSCLKEHKISAENISFGMGGALLQKVNRDMLRFAMKASYACIDGVGRDIFKDPATDQSKRSKRGRLALIKNDEGQICTIRREDLGNRTTMLVPVYENGRLLNQWTLAAVRQRALSN